MHCFFGWTHYSVCCTHYTLLALSHSSTLALFADDAKGFRTIRSFSDGESFNKVILII